MSKMLKHPGFSASSGPGSLLPGHKDRILQLHSTELMCAVWGALEVRIHLRKPIWDDTCFKHA